MDRNESTFDKLGISPGAFLLIGLAGVVLVGIFGPRRNSTHDPTPTPELGGVEAIVTPHTGCQTVILGGESFLRCSDGLEIQYPLGTTGEQ